MKWLYNSTCLLECEWYMLFNNCFTLIMVRNITKGLLVNSTALSVRTYVEMPWDITQKLKETFATCDEEVFPVGTDFVSFDYLSIISIPYWIPFTAWNKGLKLSVATNKGRSFVGNNCSVLFKICDFITCACTLITDSCIQIAGHVWLVELPLHKCVQALATVVVWHFRMIWVVQDPMLKCLFDKYLNNAINWCG